MEVDPEDLVGNPDRPGMVEQGRTCLDVDLDAEAAAESTCHLVLRARYRSPVVEEVPDWKEKKVGVSIGGTSKGVPGDGYATVLTR